MASAFYIILFYSINFEFKSLDTEFNWVKQQLSSFTDAFNYTNANSESMRVLLQRNLKAESNLQLRIYLAKVAS